MKTVNIAELKNHLSAYLQFVKNGEEIIVRDHNLPIARIVPLSLIDVSEEERQLVASGAMKLPERAIDGRNSGRFRPAMYPATLPSRLCTTNERKDAKWNRPFGTRVLWCLCA